MKNFFEKLQEWKIAYTEEQIRLIELFVREIEDKTGKFNLISKNDVCNIRVRHVLDSLAVIPVIKKIFMDISKIHVLDAGSGAGFPGIPVKIFLEDAKFELWESNQKKHAFLTWIITLLKLKNIQAINKRIGDCPRMGTVTVFNKPDIVMERAMGKLENILPQCLNITKEKGYFLAWQSDLEILKKENFKKILLKTHAEIENVHEYQLPEDSKKRFIVIFKKEINSLLL